MDKKSGVWFWVLLAVIIFVLYCLTMQRPYCQTLDELRLRQPAAEGVTSSTGTPLPVDRPSDAYKSPALFNSDTTEQARDRARTGEPSGGSPAAAAPSWVPNDTVQPILRPDQSIPEPFGYALFANQDNAPSDPYANVVPEEYQLGTGDHLHVAMWGRVDQEFELIIDRSGRVFIPKTGQIMLAGMTVTEAEKAIATRLQAIYSDFELAVTLGQLRTVRVYVFGEVRRPGAYTVGAAATLVDALYQAGGPNERGTLRRVRLVRGDQTTDVDLYDFLLTGHRTSDPRLAAGDVVFVDIAGPRAVARGRVKRPGIYELNGPTTLREFTQLAGGFEVDAYRNRIMIDRLQDTDGRQLLDVDLSGDQEITVTARPETEREANVHRMSGWDVPVLDGDDISVFSMFEARPNLVWLDGWVKHPGAFERVEGMTAGALIDWGEQLKPGAYFPRADLVRADPDGKTQLIAVDLEAVIDDMEDAEIVLHDGDRLTVYARDAVEPSRTVSIVGEVRNPGEYHLYEAMRLSDLVFQAGNMTRRALTQALEVVRKNPDGTTRTLQCNLRDALKYGDLPEDIVLKEGDYVFVRPDPNIGAHRLVHLEGEVQYPGRYSLIRDDETFHDVLQRAGGLTPQAFPAGTVFIREQISEDMQRLNYSQILQNAQPLVEDSTGHVSREELILVNPESMTRIVIDIPEIIRENGGPADIVLRPGDRITIPAIPSGIQVHGSVAAPGTIGYRKNWRVKDYISRAGGTTRSSDADGIRVVMADGQVVECGNKNRRIALGDAIFVPTRIKKSSDWLKTLTQTVSIVGGVATTVLVVQSLGN
ncbi:MAG TPA: SLBB domain-containing protein [Acidobacteriota bacterium]|nr:SLBB domain-containing protein [Acidobacteriota bacterium]